VQAYERATGVDVKAYTRGGGGGQPAASAPERPAHLAALDKHPAAGLHRPHPDRFRGRALEGVGKEELRPGVDSSEVSRAEDVRRGAIRFGAGRERLAPGVDSSEVLLEGYTKGHDARLREAARLAGGVDAARRAAGSAPAAAGVAERQEARDARDLDQHRAYMSRDRSPTAAAAKKAIEASRVPFSVDRIEQVPGRGEIAVLVNEAGEEVHTPRGMLAHDIGAGDVISKSFGRDERATADLARQTAGIQANQKARAVSGDVKIH